MVNLYCLLLWWGFVGFLFLEGGTLGVCVFLAKVLQVDISDNGYERTNIYNWGLQMLKICRFDNEQFIVRLMVIAHFFLCGFKSFWGKFL